MKTKKEVIESVRNRLPKLPKGYEWGVYSTGNKCSLDEFAVTVCLIQKEKDGEN